MIDEVACGSRTLRTTGVRILHHVSGIACAEVSATREVSRRARAEVSAALEASRRPGQRSQQLQNLTVLIVILVPSECTSIATGAFTCT
jgi:hypothetical protein